MELFDRAAPGRAELQEFEASISPLFSVKRGITATEKKCVCTAAMPCCPNGREVPLSEGSVPVFRPSVHSLVLFDWCYTRFLRRRLASKHAPALLTIAQELHPVSSQDTTTDGRRARGIAIANSFIALLRLRTVLRMEPLALERLHYQVMARCLDAKLPDITLALVLVFMRRLSDPDYQEPLLPASLSFVGPRHSGGWVAALLPCPRPSSDPGLRRITAATLVLTVRAFLAQEEVDACVRLCHRVVIPWLLALASCRPLPSTPRGGEPCAGGETQALESNETAEKAATTIASLLRQVAKRVGNALLDSLECGCLGLGLGVLVEKRAISSHGLDWNNALRASHWRRAAEAAASAATQLMERDDGDEEGEENEEKEEKEGNSCEECDAPVPVDAMEQAACRVDTIHVCLWLVRAALAWEACGHARRARLSLRQASRVADAGGLGGRTFATHLAALQLRWAGRRQGTPPELHDGEPLEEIAVQLARADCCLAGVSSNCGQEGLLRRGELIPEGATISRRARRSAILATAVCASHEGAAKRLEECLAGDSIDFKDGGDDLPWLAGERAWAAWSVGRFALGAAARCGALTSLWNRSQEGTARSCHCETFAAMVAGNQWNALLRETTSQASTPSLFLCVAVSCFHEALLAARSAGDIVRMRSAARGLASAAGPSPETFHTCLAGLDHAAATALLDSVGRASRWEWERVQSTRKKTPEQAVLSRTEVILGGCWDSSNGEVSLADVAKAWREWSGSLSSDWTILSPISGILPQERFLVHWSAKSIVCRRGPSSLEEHVCAEEGHFPTDVCKADTLGLEFNRILQGNDASLDSVGSSPSTWSNRDKAQWWKTREDLDHDLEVWLKRMEQRWGIELGAPLPDRQGPAGDGMSPRFDPLPENLNQLRVVDLRELLKERDLPSSGLKATLVDRLHRWRQTEASDRGSPRGMEEDVDAPDEEYQAAVDARPTAPVVLIPDEENQAFPWESMPALRGRPVTRVPSFSFLWVRLQGELSAKTPARRSILSVSRQRGRYALNPGGDLARTEASLAPLLKQLAGWEGLCGEYVSTETLLELVATGDIYLCVPIAGTLVS